MSGQMFQNESLVSEGDAPQDHQVIAEFDTEDEQARAIVQTNSLVRFVMKMKSATIDIPNMAEN